MNLRKIRSVTVLELWLCRTVHHNTEWSKSLGPPDDCTTIVGCTETFWSPCIFVL